MSLHSPWLDFRHLYNAVKKKKIIFWGGTIGLRKQLNCIGLI
jgi:hypothetical protein